MYFYLKTLAITSALTVALIINGVTVSEKAPPPVGPPPIVTGTPPVSPVR